MNIDTTLKPTSAMFNASFSAQENSFDTSFDVSSSNSDVPPNIFVPTKVSQLENDKGFVTEEDIKTKADLVDGKVPLEQLPDNIGSGNGGSGGAQVQADFNQNDDTQPDYIKNRIAYSNGVKNVEFFNQTLTFVYNGEDMGVYMSAIEELSDKDITSWKNLGDITIMWDTTPYLVAKSCYQGTYYWGNDAFLGLDSTGEPFVIAIDDYSKMIMLISLTDPAPNDPDNAPTIDHTIKISYQKDNVYADSKYFNMDNILTVKSGDIIHEKTKYIFEIDEDIGIGTLDLEGKFFLPHAGKNIKVYWDGVEYPCAVVSIPESDGMIAIGSIDALMNGDLSLAVEPFIIATDNAEYYTIYSLDSSLIHELKIVAEDEYQTTIDNKYLDIQLNYDHQPTRDSKNLLTSDAIFWALGGRSSMYVENSVNEYSTDPVSSQAVYNALGGRERLVIDSNVSYTDNLVSSKAVLNAVKNKIDKSDIVDDPYIFSSNPISAKAVNEALSKKVSQAAVRGYIDGDSDNPVSSRAVYVALGNRSILNIDNEIKSDSDNAVSSRAVYRELQRDKIPVTSEDNGKFMRVVDGAWAAVSVADVEEALF